MAYDVLDFFNAAATCAWARTGCTSTSRTDMNVSLHREWLLLRPRTDWAVGGAVHAAGTLLAIELDAFLAGSRELRTIFAPTAAQSLQSWSWTPGLPAAEPALRCVLQDPGAETPAAGWAAQELDACPPLHSVDAYAVDERGRGPPTGPATTTGSSPQASSLPPPCTAARCQPILPPRHPAWSRQTLVGRRRRSSTRRATAWSSTLPPPPTARACPTSRWGPRTWCSTAPTPPC